jgi:hypothetical protein
MRRYPENKYKDRDKEKPSSPASYEGTDQTHKKAYKRQP